MKIDKKDVFNTQIRPLLEKIAVICNDNQMPMFFTVVTEEYNNKTKYESKMLDADFVGAQITDNKFPDFLNLINGFKTYLPIQEDYSDIYKLEE